ncbi:MAG TPA: hypothetical protein ENK91_00220, partial [Bacteroidetes bacterium]|nr:hypothetical protein [Bacteroidota bacterium]
RDIIENIWLTIGTDNKYKNIIPNECGRIPLGEKGIGRLGVHKLGNEITLISKRNNSKEIILNIDWKKLNGIENIEDFEIELSERENLEIGNNSGTKIVIEDLKTIWDRRQLRNVYRALTSLNSPFDESNDKFKVTVSSNRKDLFDKLPDIDDIKSAALYFGKCTLEGNKIKSIKYEFKPWTSLSKIDSGRVKTTKDFKSIELEIVDIDEKKKIVPVDLNNYNIGPIDFQIMIFDRAPEIFNYVTGEKKTINTYLKENGGIRVYRDGVRVYNYGETDNDWLEIDIKRVGKLGGNVSNNIIIGAVKLNREKSTDLKEKTNREGFVEDSAYSAFSTAVRYALHLIVKERNYDKERLTVLYKKHKVIEPVLSDLNEVIEIVEEKVTEVETKNELLKYLANINSQYKEVKEILIKSANAGLNLSVVIHEIEKLISQLTGSINRNDLKKARSISLMLEKIIRGYSAMIKKSSITNHRLSSIVETALDNYQFRFSDHKIEIISNFKESKLKAFLAEAESISILTNLLDNSIYWLSYSRTENKKISIYITDQISGFNSIIVSDNGPGFTIPIEIATNPFITGKPHNIGSGLGLHIANEMMKAMKGKLLFIDEYDVDFPKVIKTQKINQAIIALCFPKEK